MNEDSPGLAMSRSLGDGQAHSIGVSCEPEIHKYELSVDDKFIVLASDGVWEFLENE
jgi:serine/threonine protein phosphatase PrpC